MKLMSLVLDPYPTITTTSVVKKQMTARERELARVKNRRWDRMSRRATFEDDFRSTDPEGFAIYSYYLVRR